MWDAGVDLKTIKDSSIRRIKNSTTFNQLNDNAHWLAEQNDKVYHLSLAKYKEEQQSIKAKVKQNNTLTKLTTELPVTGLDADNAKYENNVDKDKAERLRTWLKNLRTDVYIDETAKVINHMISMKNPVAHN
jgi:carboxyl-terminal processing protease